MLVDTILKTKFRRLFVLIVGVILVTVFLCIDSAKKIPQYGIIFYEKGLKCKNKCARDKTLQYFQKAVWHDSNLSAAYYQLALIYEKKGEHAKALEKFRKVTELTHKNSVAFYKVGHRYLKEGAYEVAQRYFLQAIIGKRDCPADVHYYLAKMFDKKKEYDLAVWHYYRIASLKPEYVDEVYLRIAEIQYSLNKEHLILANIIMFRQLEKHYLANQLERHLKNVKNSKASSQK